MSRGLLLITPPQPHTTKSICITLPPLAPPISYYLLGPYYCLITVTRLPPHTVVVVIVF